MEIFDRSPSQYTGENNVPNFLSTDFPILSKRKNSKFKHLARRIYSPAHFGLHKLMSEKLEEILLNDLRVLVIGGGEQGKGTEGYLKSENIIISDVYYSDLVNVICSVEDLPFKEGTFDLVVCQAVLEHVPYPNLAASEIVRVTKNNGHVLSEIPFLQSVHEGRFDYTRYTLEGHIGIFEGAEPLHAWVTGGILTRLCWILEDIFKVLFGEKSKWILRLSLFWLKWLEKLISERKQILYASSLAVFFIKSSTYIKSESLFKSRYETLLSNRKFK
jgi:SAM-dependent methyltransferase